MKTIDLHIHTTASDGSYSPIELVDYAVKKKLSAVAITDHDNMDGVEEAMEYIREAKLPLELIPGMEVSTHASGHPYGLHILAYFVNKTEEERKNILTHVQVDLREGSGDTKEAIKIISQYGGISVLAHPKEYYLSMKEMDTLVGELAKVGLNGVECIYTTHSHQETKQLKEIADHHHLLFTGGTDFHGSRKPGVDLGNGFGDLSIPYDIVKALKSLPLPIHHN
jgi:predicted metal-dependent phosphoesterase TrpH